MQAHLSRNKNQAGGALIVALITISVVAALGGAYLNVAISGGNRQTSEVARLKAFYLAEAGLAEAFHAVRMGRSGQMGNILEPAKYGNGLVWVDATQPEPDQIRLVATGLWNQGRATLSYTIRPQELKLGVFSDEDLVLENVVMLDGYDSSLGTYQSQVLTEEVLPDGIPEDVETFLSTGCPAGDGTNGCHMGYHQWCVGELSHLSLLCQTEGISPDTVVGDPGYATSSEEYITLRDQGLGSYVSALQDQVDGMYEEYAVSAMTNPTSGETLYPRPGIGTHSSGGAVLGSNGSVIFDHEGLDLKEVYGDVSTGPDGAVVGEEGVVLTGAMSSRGTEIELPEVTVPEVELQTSILQEDVLPLVFPSGLLGVQGVEVAADSELIIQGPATVVIGDLTLAPGGLLTLDTRLGNVDLYITGGMDFQPGSATVTTGQNPEELTLQVAPIQSIAGDPAIKLDGASAFHGTIYAPEADVFVGPSFEIFGGIVARKLTLGAGAKLHVDNASMGESPIPKIVSWRILELPTAALPNRVDPYRLLGVNKDDVLPLSESNDLTRVTLDVTYVDKSGTIQTYTGLESDFDWDRVSQVTQVSRDSTDKVAEEVALSDPPEEPAGDPLGGGGDWWGWFNW